MKTDDSLLPVLRFVAEIGEGEKKGAVIVPESLLKKRKRLEKWNLVKKEEVEAKRKKNSEKLIFKRAEEYAKEYEQNDKEHIRLKREAKLKGGFYVNPEAKLLFIIRIRGFAWTAIGILETFDFNVKFLSIVSVTFGVTFPRWLLQPGQESSRMPEIPPVTV